MHREALDFLKQMRTRSPGHFSAGQVLIVGAKEMNFEGQVRGLFGPNATVTGIDPQGGPGVDVECTALDWFQAKGRSDPLHDCILCTEVLEHDPDWRDACTVMFDMLAPGGLLLITCATKNRPVHGTDKNRPDIYCGPHYRNIEWHELWHYLGGEVRWSWWRAEQSHQDLYFCGIKEKAAK